jgi:hypothetical protein
MITHLIYGKRTVVIKKFTDHSNRCTKCGTYDLSVKVYQQYFHAFFIPVYAFGVKTAAIRCKNCTSVFRSDSLQQQYEKMAKAPFYLYSFPIIFCLLILLGLSLHSIYKRSETAYIQHPMAGDVYLLRPGDAPIYYFLKVVSVRDDSLITHRNSINYTSFVSEPTGNDSFTIQEMWISRKDLQEMFDNNIIESVDRSKH